MSNNLSRKKCKNPVSQQNLWNEAITDAEAKLVEAKKRVNALRSAIRTLKENRDCGEPWPGKGAESATQN